MGLIKIFGGIIAISLFVAPTAGADPTLSAISQGYETTSSNLGQGALVSLTSTSSAVIGAANTNNATNLVGIVADKPLLELSSGKSTVQVVVSGSTQALVSDINGPVKVGDKVTASPISGIGMKAIGSTEVIGTAQKNLSSVPTIKENVTNQEGKGVATHVGLLPVTVNVAYYSAIPSQGTVSSFVPPFLQTIANALTGRAVSPLRVLLASVALTFGFTVVAIMLFVSVRNGVISIGRNPLAEIALRRGLVDVIIAAMGVLIITLVIIYAVLLS